MQDIQATLHSCFVRESRSSIVLKGLSCSMSMAVKGANDDDDRDQIGFVGQFGSYISYCRC
jgi:hypothetical protein